MSDRLPADREQALAAIATGAYTGRVATAAHPLCICRCPQYPEQQRHAGRLREQEYAARDRLEGQRSARQHGKRRHVEPDDDTATVSALPAGDITDRFRLFDQTNPHIRVRLVQLIEQHLNHGARRLGIGALFEELRWSGTETNGDHYRLNHDYRAHYVRALIADHPEWRDLFELRGRRAS